MANFIKSYKELEEAFRFKRKNPAYPEYRFQEGKLKYEGENGIFDQARNRFFNRLPLPKNDLEMVNQILNTIDARKTSLEQYLNPHQTLPPEAGQLVESSAEQIAAAPAGQMATGESAATMAGGNPTAPSAPGRPTMIPNIPQASMSGTAQTGGVPKTEVLRTRRSMLLNPQVPANVANLGKNVQSSTSIFLKRGGSSLFKGLGELVGAGGRGLGSFGLRAVNGGLDRAQAISRNAHSIRSSFKGSSIKKSRFALALLGAMFLFMFISGILAGIGGPGAPTGEAAPLPGRAGTNLVVSLAGPGGCTDNCKVDNNQEVSYEISLTYNGFGTADVAISGQTPNGAHLSKASSENWGIPGSTFSQTLASIPAKENRKLSLTLKPDDGKIDFWASFNVNAKVVSGVIDTPPNDDTCAGKYTSQIQDNLLHQNFGDPTCTYSDDDLYTSLEQLDPAQAPFWWLLVDCESTYRPNITNASADDTAGAWGLFQMGRGKNGPLDRGDVPWIKQISNAVNYKNSLENGPPKFRFRGEESYWRCARPGGLNITANKPRPAR